LQAFVSSFKTCLMSKARAKPKAIFPLFCRNMDGTSASAFSLPHFALRPLDLACDFSGFGSATWPGRVGWTPLAPTAAAGRI
jgi:hypothetical protein